ncbi:Signal transduction histidine-protein kinase BarA [Thalassocella blandensis]|nr:Signal transduction histidine-protein kinase BarA [Thalassocella blandensis]
MNSLGRLFFSRTTFAILLLGGSAVFGIAYITHLANQNKVSSSAKEQAVLHSNAIIERLRLYETGLKFTKASVEALKGDISHITFRRYVNSLQIERHFVGAKGLGFTQYVPREQKDTFLQTFKDENGNILPIKHLSQNDGDLYVIKYIEPLNTNAEAVGLDIASEENRKLAALKSAKSKTAIMTAPITLVQGDGEALSSVLMLLPVYIEQADSELLLGWVYAPLIIRDVLQGLDVNSQFSSLTIQDEQSNQLKPLLQQTIADRRGRINTQALQLTILGRPWLFTYEFDRKFRDGLGLIPTFPIVFIGILLSILLAFVVAVVRFNRTSHSQIEAQKFKLGTIVESSMDAIISKDLDGVVLSWNKGAESIFGFSAREAIGKKVADLILPVAYLHEEHEILYRIANCELIPHFESIRKRRDGSSVNVSIAVSPLYDANAEVIAASTVIRDITEQKTKEIEIRKLNAELETKIESRTKDLQDMASQLRTILDAIPSVIGYWDKNLINCVANNAYIDWFGVTPEQVKGMHVKEFLGESVYNVSRPYLDAALAGKSQLVERNLVRPDGSPLYCMIQYMPDIVNGEVQGLYIFGYDITEVKLSQKKLNTTLRENDALLGTIETYLLHTIADIEGNITEVDEAFCSLMGYQREELLGKSQHVFGDGQLNEAFWEEVYLGKSWRGELRLKTKFGYFLWFDTIIAPFIGENGEIIKIVTLRSNITDKKQAEEQRDSSNKLLSNVLSASTEVAIMATDMNGLITLFNTGAEKLLHYPADQLIGRATPLLFHSSAELQKLQSIKTRAMDESTETAAQAVSIYDCLVRRARAMGVDHQQFTYLDAMGKPVNVVTTITPVLDNDNKHTGYLFVVLDISKDLLQQKQIASINEQLQIATNTAELGVWTWDLNSGGLEWNDQMFKIFDKTPPSTGAAVSSDIWRSCLHPEDLDSTLKKLKALAAGEQIHTHEFRIVKSEDDIGYIQAGAQIEFDANGVAARITGICRDITISKEVEKRLQLAKEKSDQASFAKSAFIANMSHEIRTPMNAVIGLLRLLQKTALNSDQAEYVRKTDTAAKSLLGLLNDLLDFSKIDAENLTLEEKTFDLELLMQELAISMSVAQNSEHNVDIVFDTSLNIPRNIIGDKLRLQQVLLNITGNALKFTKRGSIRVAIEMLYQQANNVKLRFSVRDTGIGIAEENLATIFESFSQVEASMSRRFGGVGLGLNISNKLVELMGSEIKIDSVLGEGSCFYFDVSFATPASDDCILLEHQSNQKKLLLLESSERHQMHITNIVKSQGWDVISLEEWKHVVPMLSNTHVDAMIVNMDLPNVKLETLQEAFQAERLLPIPLLALSHADGSIGHALEGVTVKGLNKPFTPFQLIQALNGLSPAEDSYEQGSQEPVSQGKGTQEKGSQGKGSQENGSQEKNSSDSAILASKVEAPAEESALPLQGRSILVVEDNALNREVVEQILEDEGAEVEMAENGRIGVDKVLSQRGAFDLVIMDIQMPEMDGFEATRKIREHAEFDSLPIVAMTANVQQEDIDACIDSGMNAHLAKPIDIDVFIPKLIEILQGKGSSSAKVQDTTLKDSDIEKLETLLRRFGNNKSRYRKVLMSFVPEVDRLLNQLVEDKKLDTTDSAVTTLHTIKGVASTMGANLLASMAASLEQQLKQNDAEAMKQNLSQEVLDELKNVLLLSNRQLYLLVKEKSAEKKLNTDEPPKNLEEWKAKLKSLIRLLETDNLSAIDLAEQIINECPIVSDGRLSELMVQVNRLEYEAAIHTVNALLDQS